MAVHILLLSIVLFLNLAVAVATFVPSATDLTSAGKMRDLYAGSSLRASTFGSSGAEEPPAQNNQQQQRILPEEQDQPDQKQQHFRANRFSKFAPSSDLDTDEFRAQLRENMKRDLEERRRKDTTRGNQPAKGYLDSL